MGKELRTEQIKEILTIEDASKSICVLEGSNERALAGATIYLKSYTNQVVIASNSFVYKIYETANNQITFDHVVREALSQVYNELGLHWDFVSFERDESVFDFEQRQTLRVCNPEDDGPFENIILSISDVYAKVEKLLHFDEILLSLKKRTEFAQVEKLCLTRAIVNKYNDYAMFGNQAILLDDAEFCIALLDGEKRILDIPDKEVVDLSTSLGDFQFKKYRGRGCQKQDKIDFITPSKFYSVYHAWTLMFPEKETADIVKANVATKSHLLTKEDDERSMYVYLRTDSPHGIETEEKVDSQVEKGMITISSPLTDSSEKEIYEQLCDTDFSQFDVCLSTSFNGEGEVLKKERLVRWGSHMKTITTHFPTVKKRTQIFLTNEFCELYLQNEFDLVDFSGRFGTDLVFRPPCEGHDKPSRMTFRKFLSMLARNNRDYFSNLFSGDLRNNYCGQQACGGGHDSVFEAYSDCDNCMFCDYLNLRDVIL